MELKMKAKIGRSPSYLIRNHYTYCFRMKVPHDIQPYVGKKELRYSLKTGYVGVAKFKARIIAGQVQLLFKSLKNGNTSLMKLSNNKIKELVQKYLRQLVDSYAAPAQPLSKSDETLLPFHDQPTFNSYVNMLDSIKEDFLLDRAMGKYDSVDDKAEQLLKENGVEEVDKNSPSYWKLCEGLMGAEIKGIDFHKKHLVGEYIDEDNFPADEIGEVTKRKRVGHVSEKISKIANEFWSWGVTEREWKPTSQSDFRRAINHFLKYFGEDTRVHTIDFQEMKKYKQGLMDKGIGLRTLEFYLGRAKAFFNYAKQYKYLDKSTDNPVEGLMPKDTRRKDTLRDVFDREDLEKLFCNSKEYSEDKHTKAENFWIPLIALFTGCRREEICQLYVEDVKEVNGVWVLDINEDAPDKRIKTGDARLVPLHPFLVRDLRFIEYVNSIKGKEVRVFHKLKRIKHKYGHSLGNWFGKFKKRCGIVAPPGKKVFHSFRHTIINHLLQKDVQVHVIKQLVGHSDKSITTGLYGKPFSPKKLLEDAVMKLDYGIDLSHLKESKYVPKD